MTCARIAAVLILCGALVTVAVYFATTASIAAAPPTTETTTVRDYEMSRCRVKRPGQRIAGDGAYDAGYLAFVCTETCDLTNGMLGPVCTDSNCRQELHIDGLTDSEPMHIYTLPELARVMNERSLSAYGCTP